MRKIVGSVALVAPMIPRVPVGIIFQHKPTPHENSTIGQQIFISYFNFVQTFNLCICIDVKGTFTSIGATRATLPTVVLIKFDILIIVHCAFKLLFQFHFPLNSLYYPFFQSGNIALGYS